MNLKDRQTICCFWPQKHMNHYCNSYAEVWFTLLNLKERG
jgi:hypothetical protein